MKCREYINKIGDILSSIAVFLSLYGIYKQAESVKNKKNKLTAIFPIMLVLTLFLRLPTILCIAFENKSGWFSVIILLLKMIGLIYLSYLSI
jgi:hypothetical protein